MSCCAVVLCNTSYSIIVVLPIGLHLYVIPANQTNVMANNLTTWLRNETDSTVEKDTYSNSSGIVLARSGGGLTITVAGDFN